MRRILVITDTSVDAVQRQHSGPMVLFVLYAHANVRYCWWDTLILRVLPAFEA